jgi:hypothetical protein
MKSAARLCWRKQGGDAVSNKSDPDRYERTYMRANDALARQRIPMAWWGHALFATPFALILRAVVAQPRAALFVALAIVSLLWLLLMTLRVAVTRTHVHVQLGFFGPKIPIGNIESVQAGRGPRLRTGWGIRLGIDGAVTYSVPAPIRDYLEIVYRTGSRQRIARVMTDDPKSLVDAINTAREQRTEALSGKLRIDDSALEAMAGELAEVAPREARPRSSR